MLIHNHNNFVMQYTQVFGTHKVPIPSTSKELETFMYAGDKEHWNTTCGSHRKWSDSKRRWVTVPQRERQCSNFYEKFPFVFSMAGSEEELRQGTTVLHESSLM